MDKFDYIVIGGGVVGLATAWSLLRSEPGMTVAVLEKENALAQHQTGRNSGVIHSGIYYKPGSAKARFARAGNRSMVEFCQEHGIRHEVCGKVIVATREGELPLLENLYKRALENGLAAVELSARQVREIEPHVSCLAGVKVPSTGIVNFSEVCAKLAEMINSEGGTLVLGAQVKGHRELDGVHWLETSKGTISAKFMINCGGLHSDRIAQMTGVDPRAKIVPFRGEYYQLVPDKRHLVKSLIYPVPNPDFPFLGVHFTRMIDGSVHAGPNAVLAFKREGYQKSDFSLRDFVETMTFGGFWKLARKNAKEGIQEMKRSFSKVLFVRSLQQLIPEIRSEDLVPCKAGVRAQALMADGQLVDDFLIVRGRNSLHVCNAPSPAATASLEIGMEVTRQVLESPGEGQVVRSGGHG